MQGRGGRRRWRRRLIGLLIAPPLLWAAVLTVMPTGWARQAIERRIEQESGCPARLSAVRFGPLGGVRLEGLALLEPGDPEDATPWVEIGSVRVDLSPGELLMGRAAPRSVEVVGLDLRLVRGADGRFAAGYLLRNAPPPPPGGPDGRTVAPGERGPIAFRLDRGRVAFIDEAMRTSVKAEDLSCRGTWWPSVIDLDELRGTINGGAIAMAAEIERGPRPSFDARLSARGVYLGQQMGMLAYLLPYLAGVSERLEGRLDLDLELKGEGASAAEFRSSLAGRGALRVDPIRLDGSTLLMDLARILPITEYGKIGSIRSDFRVADRRVDSQRMTLRIGGTPVVLSGGTGFDGRVDYRLDISSLAGRFGPEGAVILAEFGLDPTDVLDLRIGGTTDRPMVLVGGRPLDADASLPTLRDLSRRLRDQLLR